MEEELLKRWRLILGGDEADGTGVTLNLEEQRIDHSLEAVYDSDRRGGLGSSAPKVSRWLGDIREFFPQTVVQVIQRDAIKRHVGGNAEHRMDRCRTVPYHDGGRHRYRSDRYADGGAGYDTLLCTCRMGFPFLRMDARY